ncbi:hypothetical protein JCM11641_000326 [Rhodosporidiobolus odoratus]
MESASRTPLPEHFSSFPRSATVSAPSKVPRSLPSAELVNNVLRSSKHLRSPSPMFSISAEYDVETSDGEGTLSRTLTSKSHIAPGSSVAIRTHSPSPLLWSQSGWAAGHFTFSPFDSPGRGISEQQRRDDTRSGGDGDTARKSASPIAAGLTMPTSSTPVAVSSELSSPLLRSKLAPTAMSFVPKVAPLTSAGPPPSPAPLNTSAPYSYPRNGPSTGPSSSPSSSPIEPCTPPPFPPSEAHLDYNGHLVSHGAKYAIAEEILQLQATPMGTLHPDELETLSTYEQAGSHSRTRTISEGSNFTRGIEHWRMQQHSPAVPSTFPLRQGSFPPAPSSASGHFERSRSSSIASTTSSHFASRPSLERAATAAQLQSYFGPSNVEVNAPLPTGFDSFEAAYPGAPPAFGNEPRHLYRTSSYGSLQTTLYPPLAHPEPFNLTPEDPLYMQARDVFVDSSCSSLSGPPTIAHRQSLATHFDRAMHTLNPLASLYGLSPEAANQLLSEPEKSGVSELVLKVAAMRGRQQQMASVQRSAMGASLPGPSPNNRKLNLYKTELCRSWEEKGSCRYGVKCQFAHGIQELREVARHPKFKSEVCRTFWQQGSCPYGKRCCFIHASGDAAFESDISSARTSAPGSRAESPAEHTTSRLQQRMTSTAITSAPSRTFGPALSELISSGTSSSAGSSLQPWPNASRLDLAASVGPSTASYEPSALFGLGISQRSGQAPPTFREEPKSRLQRLTSLSGVSTPATTMSPSLPTVTTFQPHARQNSGNSFATSSSASTGPASSPLLARHGSSSSLSSGAGSPVLLRPLGGEWLSSAHVSAKTAALEWPSELEHLALDDVSPFSGQL